MIEERPGRAPFRIPLALALVAALLYLVAAASRDFWAPDEPDFAEHVREMLERRDLLVPYENGKPYSEKPILFYWAMAATTPFTGNDVTPLGTRVPCALAAASLVLGAAYLAGFRGGSNEALMAGAATAVAPGIFWQGQFLQVDALFTALLLWAFLAMLFVEEDVPRSGRWLWAFHVLVPLAVLTKGPLAVALVGLVVVVRAAVRRSLRPITILAPVRAAAVFVVLVVPWYVAAARAGGPEYTYGLIVKQNWERFSNAFDHIQPWWYYLESIWGLFFPWTALALAAPFVLARSGLLSRRPELRTAGVIVATAFLFLSASESKQGKYLLVAYPLAAALAAAAVPALERHASIGLRVVRGYLVVVAASLLGAAVALAPVARSRAPEYAFLAPYLAIPLGVGALGTMVVLWRRKGAMPSLLALAATLGAAEAIASLVVLPAIDTRKTGRPFYERIRPRVSRGEPLAYFGETYRCYPILILRRKTEHFRAEAPLARWVERTPGALVLVDESERQHWTLPALRALAVVDRQPVGGDEALLLGRP